MRQKKYFFPPLNKKIASTKKRQSPRGASNYLLLLSCCKKSFCSQLLSGSFSSPELGLSCSPPADSRLFKQSADIPESRLGQSGGCRKEGRTCFLTSQPVTVISATHTEGGGDAHSWISIIRQIFHTHQGQDSGRFRSNVSLIRIDRTHIKTPFQGLESLY